MGIIMAKTTKTMRITLTEDFLVPTDDGNIIFEPGDEIEVEYEDEDLAADEVPETDLVDDVYAAEPEVPEVDPLSFAGNPEVAEPEVPVLADDPLADDEDEVYIEDPAYMHHTV